MIELTALKQRHAEMSGQRTLLLRQHDTLTEQHTQSQAEITLLSHCLALCESLTDSARERVAHVIGPVCSAALRDVFDSTYSLDVLHTQQPSGKYVSRLVVASDGETGGNPMSVRGGSVVGVLSIFLPAAVSLLRPDLVQSWFSLDEPCGMLGGARLRSCAEAVRQLTSDKDRPLQVILTTQQFAEWDGLCDVHVHLVKDKSGDVVAKITRNDHVDHGEGADL